jgi:hypothetical protein
MSKVFDCKTQASAATLKNWSPEKLFANGVSAVTRERLFIAKLNINEVVRLKFL